MKTTNDKIKKWEQTGLLEGLKKDKKEYLANLLEDLTTIFAFTSGKDGKELFELMNVIYPIARRLVDNSIKVEAFSLLGNFKKWLPTYKKSKHGYSVDNFEADIIHYYVSDVINKKI